MSWVPVEPEGRGKSVLEVLVVLRGLGAIVSFGMLMDTTDSHLSHIYIYLLNLHLLGNI